MDPIFTKLERTGRDLAGETSAFAKRTRGAGETFVLDLRDACAAVPDLPGVTARLSDPHTLEVDVPKAEGLNRVFARLSEAGIEVLSLRNKVNRLEELFLRLVEKHA